MPTENRSSNTEMVSVPRYLAEEVNAALINHGHVVLPRGLQEAMNAQAGQHQGKPVALPARKLHVHQGLSHTDAKADGWNACLDEIAKLGPLYTRPAPAVQQEPVATLYTAIEKGFADFACLGALDGGPFYKMTPLYPHADPGEVERLRNCLRTEIEAGDSWKKEAQDLRVQLAERDALLTRALPYLSNTPDLVQHGAEDLAEEIRSASAGLPCYGPNEWGTECGKCSKCKHASAEPSAPKCGNCESATGQACNDKGCGYLEAGNGALVERDERSEFEVAPVLGFPSYSVSSDGIVYRNDSGNAIAQQANSKGYLTVNLSESGKATRRTVHRVVLESFVGVRPEGLQALHGDGNPANNRLSNLQWGESSENEADKSLHGTKAIGSRNGASRLTEAMVQEILEAKRVGGKKWGAGLLAKKFGVDISTITRAARGKHWSEARAALERKP